MNSSTRAPAWAYPRHKLSTISRRVPMTLQRSLSAALPFLTILCLTGCGATGTVKPAATQANADKTAVESLIASAPEFAISFADDGVPNPGKKPLLDQKTRYALFKKIWFHADSTSDDSTFGWRLVGVSPVEFTMIDPARQTVAIHSVTLTGEHTHVTISDPATLLSLGRTAGLLPIFRGGETVKVEAAVTNTDHGYAPPTFVYLHAPISDRHLSGPHDWIRIFIYDDGSHGDVAAGDGTFTAEWTVRNLGPHHIAVDVLNSRCLQNQTDDDYNSTTWAVPLASYPSWLPTTAAL